VKCAAFSSGNPFIYMNGCICLSPVTTLPLSQLLAIVMFTSHFQDVLFWSVVQQQVRGDGRGRTMIFARNVIQERVHRAHPLDGKPGLCAR
jgi:hypothetical protein